MIKHHVLVWLASLLIGASLVFVSGEVSAQKPSLVGAHQHFITVNGEKVYVGPNFCEVDASAQGFSGFHHKVHLTDPGLVNVNSEGCP